MREKRDDHEKQLHFGVGGEDEAAEVRYHEENNIQPQDATHHHPGVRRKLEIDQLLHRLLHVEIDVGGLLDYQIGEHLLADAHVLN